MTLIAWTQLTSNFSVLISDALISQENPETSVGSDKLPSDTFKDDQNKSKNLGYIASSLTPKTHVPHPSLAISMAGSVFVAEMVLRRVSEETVPDQLIDSDYLIELCSELDSIKSFEYLIVHSSSEAQPNLYHSKGFSCAKNHFGFDLISAGSGSWHFENSLAMQSEEDIPTGSAYSEHWLATVRGMTLSFLQMSHECLFGENLFHSYGGLFECLFINHHTGDFFSYTDLWQHISRVNPITPVHRQQFPVGIFMCQSYDKNTKLLILDRYTNQKQSSRGFKCTKRRFFTSRTVKDYRTISKVDGEIWCETYFIFFPDEKTSDFCRVHIDIKKKNDRYWIKRKARSSHIEFIWRGYPAERGTPNCIFDDRLFSEFLSKFSKDPNSHYTNPYNRKRLRSVNNDLVR